MALRFFQDRKLLVIFFLILFSNGFGQVGFSFHGTAPLPNGYTVRLQYFENGRINTDSAKVFNRQFSFPFSNRDVKLATISVDKLNGLKIFMIDKKTKIVLDTAKIWKSIPNNSPISLEFEEINRPVDSLYLLIQRKVQARSSINPKKDSVSYAQIGVEINEILNDILEYKSNFIKHHPSNVISLFYLKDLTYFNNEAIEIPFQSLHGTITKHNLYVYFKQRIIASKKIKIGNKFSIASFRDISGKLISLRSLQGKFILINFWGTWCGPCRAEIPLLTQLRKAYNRDELAIVSIAWEDKNVSPKEIRSFAKDNGMDWHQVICYKNNKDYNSEIISILGIDLFPTNILIDRMKNIIIWIASGKDGLSTIPNGLITK
ncbi:MAG: TlpA disulfide reductase family protein [Bacteroidota bacterium]